MGAFIQLSLGNFLNWKIVKFWYPFNPDFFFLITKNISPILEI